MKLLTTQIVEQMQNDKFCFIKKLLHDVEVRTIREFKDDIVKELSEHVQVSLVILRLNKVIEVDLLRPSKEYLYKTIRYSWLDHAPANLPRRVLNKIYTQPLVELYTELLSEAGFKMSEKEEQPESRSFYVLSTWRKT